jgi:hypothetical protein
MSQRHLIWSFSQPSKRPGPLITECCELVPKRGFDELGVNQGIREAAKTEAVKVTS